MVSTATNLERQHKFSMMTLNRQISNHTEMGRPRCWRAGPPLGVQHAGDQPCRRDRRVERR